MKIAILYGSNRSARQGIKAALFVKNQLESRGIDCSLVDSKVYKLPLLDKMYKEYPKGEAPENMEAIHQILEKADGFAIVSGEYNHSIPAALKNMLDHFQKEYLFKPAAIVCYSAGSFGGMRVAMHLRAILPELGMISIPSLFAISKVQDSFDNQGKALNESYNNRFERFYKEFDFYLKALKNQRNLSLPL